MTKIQLCLGQSKGELSVKPFMVVLTWAEMVRPLHISVSQPLGDMGQLPQEGVQLSAENYQRITRGNFWRQLTTGNSQQADSQSLGGKVPHY